MSVGRTCPKCQSFDVREVTVGGDDLRGYSCHDCLHVFYLSTADLEREQQDIRAGKVTRLPRSRQPKRR
jgi:transposase-like protein